MPRWKIAAVQMDCAFAEKSKNLDTIRARLREAAANEAQLVIFPECALPGLVANQPREMSRATTVLNNSFGMLGINSVLIVKKI